jgi:hypothetical protein
MGTKPVHNTEKWNLKFGMNYGYVESVNRRTIDQTVVTPTITTTLQQNDWLPFQTITQEILSRIQNK